MQRHTQGRRLHLIDIENLTGQPRPNRSTVAVWSEIYRQSGLVRAGDLCVLACNHGAAIEAGLGWPNARLLVRSGPDGADNALLDVLTDESVRDRFDEVVIGSGDGIFTEQAAGLAADGLPTTIAHGVGKLSRRLELAASQVVALGTLIPATGIAASRSAA
jgi:hypothetical protein